MRIAAEPKGNGRCAQIGDNLIGRRKRAPGGVIGEARRTNVTQSAAQLRPYSVGRDKRDAAFLRGAAGGKARGSDAIAVVGEVVDPRSEMERDIGMRQHRLEQDGLEIAAVDHPVGGAVALLDGRTERRPGEHAGTSRAHHPELFGNDDVRPQLLAEAERDQNARCVG